MNGKGIVKKITLFTSMIPLLFILKSSDIKKDMTYIYRSNIKVSKGKIEYSKGTIYIGDSDYLDSQEDLGFYDVLALDERNDDKDPNIKIIDSYRFHNPEIREEIIEGLLMYEEKYPSDWNRTRKTLSREWQGHNTAHFFGLKQHRTTDVDLNNKDEDSYRLSYYLLPSGK